MNKRAPISLTKDSCTLQAATILLLPLLCAAYPRYVAVPLEEYERLQRISDGVSMSHDGIDRSYDSRPEPYEPAKVFQRRSGGAPRALASNVQPVYASVPESYAEESELRYEERWGVISNKKMCNLFLHWKIQTLSSAEVIRATLLTHPQICRNSLYPNPPNPFSSATPCLLFDLLHSPSPLFITHLPTLLVLHVAIPKVLTLNYS